jgi:hypothetical protein
MSVKFSQLRDDLGLTGKFGLGQLRNLSNTGKNKIININRIKNNDDFKGLTRFNTANNLTEIITKVQTELDGLYWINFNGNVIRTPCLLNKKWFGGGWIGINPNLFPITSSSRSTASWVDNSNNFFNFNSLQIQSILDVVVAETGCPGPESFYSISSTNANIIGNAERLLLMFRFNTIGQCSKITNFTSAGYIDNINTFNDNLITRPSLCTWGDNIWAPSGNSAFDPNNNDIKKLWILRGRTNQNTITGFRWDNACGSWNTGKHYHLWFYRENRDVPSFTLNNGKTLIDPALKESYSSSSSIVLFNLTPINTGDLQLNGSHTFNTDSSGVIRLNNTSLDSNLNTSRINVSSREIRSISLWYFIHGTDTTRFFLDARPTLSNGFISNSSIGSDWSTTQIYINNSSLSTTISWSNIEVINQWRCITIVRPSSYTGTLNLFSNNSNNQGYNITFGPIFINNSETTGSEHIEFYNYYKERFGKIITTYQEFINFIDTKTSSIISGSSYPPMSGSYTNYYKINSMSQSGSMWGTPWGTWYTDDSVMNRVVQHSLPSLNDFNTIISNNATVLIRINRPGTTLLSYISLNRNGFTSSVWSSSWANSRCTELIYWDFISNSAKIMYPFNSIGPLDFTEDMI